jgi:hypothetical protein
MTEFRFDPPLTLKGNVVVRNLDDAVRFMIRYREAPTCAADECRLVH